VRPLPTPPGAGQESVWDYPRPPRVERTPRRVRIEHRGAVLLDTHDVIRVLETSHPPVYYVPRAALEPGVLVPCEGSSHCEWKGQAVYWDVRVHAERLPRVGWSYPISDRGCELLADRIAFYAGPFDRCFVDDHLVTPQPGGFYGGWVTPDVVGPFKGGPGSWGW